MCVWLKLKNKKRKKHGFKSNTIYTNICNTDVYLEAFTPWLYTEFQKSKTSYIPILTALIVTTN